jgi:5''-methylthioadenosine/S-adenosylhomocysteine nucleosidase
MKTAGIIVAMNEELVYIRSMMEIIDSKNMLDTDFYTGKLGNTNVVLVRSGVGKVNAASCTQSLIDLHNVDYVINVGSAGAIDKNLNVGDVVIASDLVQHDFDASAFGDALGIIPRMEESYFKSDMRLLDIAKRFANENILPVNFYFGRIASGDKFVSDDLQKELIYENFNAYCTEMEGAAVAQVCYLNNIPVIVIRTITDKADKNAIGYYKKFMSQATKNTCGIIKYILNEY